MINHSDLVKQWFILKTAFSKSFLWWITCYLKKNLYGEQCDHQHFMSEEQRKNLEFLAGFKPMERLTEEQGQILESFTSKLKVSPPFLIPTRCNPNNKQGMCHVNLTQWIEHPLAVNLVMDSRFFFLSHIYDILTYTNLKISKVHLPSLSQNFLAKCLLTINKRLSV